HLRSRQRVVEQFERRRALDVERNNRARKNDKPAHRQNRQLFRDTWRVAFVHPERDGTLACWLGIHAGLQRVQLFSAHECFRNGSEIKSNPMRCSAFALSISTSAGKVISRSNGP